MGRRHCVRQKQSRRILGRITYSPNEHKGKWNKKLREELAKRSDKSQVEGVVTSHASEIKFGSMNLDGLNHESHLAVSELLEKYQFDVSIY